VRSLVLAITGIALLFAAPHTIEAGQITYTIQNYPADQNGASLSGTITTDGVIGNLASTDILSWSWTVTPPAGAPVTVSSSDVNAFPVFIDGSVVASQLSITMAAPADGSLSELRLFAVDPVTGEFDLDYQRDFLNGPPILNRYEADFGQNQNIWNTTNPAMGGHDPWVIATAAAAVPEPSGAVLLGLGIAGLLLGRTLHRSNRKTPQ
jgi:hypothetical protein